MKRSYISCGMLAAITFAAADVGSGAAITEVAVDETTKKSIVPAKYSGKYKGAGDAVSEFIKAQTEGVFASMAALCRKNGIAEEQVVKYEQLVAKKGENHGIEGRARMTLGNMLRAKARKEEKLLSLAGDEVPFTDLKKPAVSGAAAKAQETAAETESTEAVDAAEVEVATVDGEDTE